MVYPHISTILNNCPLNLLTPELIIEIKKRAAAKEYTNRYDANYDLLRNKFAEFYEIDGNQFSWQDFSLLLDQYNPFDVQIILGPVLRLFIAQTMQVNPELPHYIDESLEDFIKKKTLITADGRYDSLSPDEIFTHLSKPLGFNIRYHQGNNSLKFDPVDAGYLGLLEIYHQGGIEGAQAGGHWERGAPGEPLRYYEREDDVKLNAYAALLGNHPYVTSKVLELLKTQLRFRHQALKENQDYHETFNNFSLSLAQIEKFIYNINFVPKALALQLLGDELTSEAEDFSDNYPVSFEYDSNFTELVANTAEMIDSQSLAKQVDAAFNFDSRQYDIILTLLTPAVVPANRAATDSPEYLGGIGSKELRRLTLEELLALNKVSTILFEEGLSAALYRLCNRSDIASRLTDNFIKILLGDEHFLEKAQGPLLQQAKKFFPEEIAKREEGQVQPLSLPRTFLFVSEPLVLPSHQPMPEENVKKKLGKIIITVEKSLSHYVLFGIKRSDKAQALRSLYQRLQQDEANIQDIYRDLLLVVTTHRTRLSFFSCFFSRTNNVNTNSAIALSKTLAAEENSNLRERLGIKTAAPASIRAEFKEVIAGRDELGSLIKK